MYTSTRSYTSFPDFQYDFESFASNDLKLQSPLFMGALKSAQDKTRAYLVIRLALHIFLYYLYII